MQGKPDAASWSEARAAGVVPSAFSGRRPVRTGPSLVADEGGSVMAFAAISVFVLVGFMAMTFNFGQVISIRMEMQNAADGAAYSAGLVKANSMNSMVWINDGMAVVYWWLMRYAVDTIHLGVLAELADHPRNGSPKPKFQIVGIMPPSATVRYKAALASARINIPRGELLLQKLSKMARGIAWATPVLMKKEAYKIAKMNGAQRCVVFGAGQGVRRFTGKYAYFEDEKPRRFYRDYTVGKVGKNELPSWFNPEKGKTNNDREYHQTRICWIPYIKALSWNYDKHQNAFDRWLRAAQVISPISARAAQVAVRGAGAALVAAPNPRVAQGITKALAAGLTAAVAGATAEALAKMTTPPTAAALAIPFAALTASAAALGQATFSCPVCHGRGHGGAGPFAVRMYQKDIRNKAGQSINLKRFTMPLVLKKDAFDPVHVGCWYPQTQPLLFFTNPSFGTFAFASSQVGFLKPGGKIDTSNKNLSSFSRSDNNLHLINFAARLLPEKNALTGRLNPRLLTELQLANWADPANGRSDPRMRSRFGQTQSFGFGR
ncbi:MAG: Tad domain-containing protein [Planctomycetes bacterium]|nr:Tad domain-containing protein [Planctomycetota bacterium]